MSVQFGSRSHARSHPKFVSVAAVKGINNAYIFSASLSFLLPLSFTGHQQELFSRYALCSNRDLIIVRVECCICTSCGTFSRVGSANFSHDFFLGTAERSC